MANPIKNKLVGRHTNNRLQTLVEDALTKHHYQFVPNSRFEASRYLEQPIYSTQVPVSKTIYETQAFCDFVLYHPQKYPDCLIMEAKWQEKGGSVDEKYPYIVQNIKICYPYKTLLILDGGGYKAAAEAWLKRQVDAKLIAVMDVKEFSNWVAKGNL